MNRGDTYVYTEGQDVSALCRMYGPDKTRLICLERMLPPARLQATAYRYTNLLTFVYVFLLVCSKNRTQFVFEIAKSKLIDRAPMGCNALTPKV